MTGVRLTLVRNLKNPSGIVVSAEDLSGIVDAVTEANQSGDTLFLVSLDTSLDKAKKIAKYLSTKFSDAFVVGHPSGEDFAVSFLTIDDSTASDIEFYASYADSETIERILDRCATLFIDSKYHQKKWHDIIVKVSEETGESHQKYINRAKENAANTKASEARDKGVELGTSEIIQVKSSLFRSVKYSEKSKELHLFYLDGRIYTYLAIPKTIFTAFIEASSKGKYFNEFIRGRFEFKYQLPVVIDTMSVNSSTIKSISYRGLDLIVEFKDDKKYLYKEVPRTYVENLVVAESAMTYFNKNIKTNFAFRKLS